MAVVLVEDLHILSNVIQFILVLCTSLLAFFAGLADSEVRKESYFAEDFLSLTKMTVGNKCGPTKVLSKLCLMLL